MPTADTRPRGKQPLFALQRSFLNLLPQERTHQRLLPPPTNRNLHPDASLGNGAYRDRRTDREAGRVDKPAARIARGMLPDSTPGTAAGLQEDVVHGLSGHDAGGRHGDFLQSLFLPPHGQKPLGGLPTEDSPDEGLGTGIIGSIARGRDEKGQFFASTQSACTDAPAAMPRPLSPLERKTFNFPRRKCLGH